MHQVTLILDLLGTPQSGDASCLGFVPREDAGKFLARQKSRPPVPFERVVPRASASARDLLKGLLLFNPRERTSVQAALAHAFFADVPQLPCGRLARDLLLAHARAAKVGGSSARARARD